MIITVVAMRPGIHACSVAIPYSRELDPTVYQETLTSLKFDEFPLPTVDELNLTNCSTKYSTKAPLIMQFLYSKLN